MSVAYPPCVAWGLVVEVACALEGLTSVEEERIVEVDTVAEARAPVRRSCFGIDLGVGIPETLGDVRLEEANPIEEEAILEAEGQGLLSIVMRIAPLVRLGV